MPGSAARPSSGRARPRRSRPRSPKTSKTVSWSSPRRRSSPRPEAAMLSREDNELLCRVGPGTAMGALLRQYWIPALTSRELPEPDGSPVRVRLLGENLVAVRVTSGAVGLLQNHCPHRGASLFFGRNEG